MYLWNIHCYSRANLAPKCASFRSLNPPSPISITTWSLHLILFPSYSPSSIYPVYTLQPSITHIFGTPNRTSGRFTQYSGPDTGRYSTSQSQRIVRRAIDCAKSAMPIESCTTRATPQQVHLPVSQELAGNWSTLHSAHLEYGYTVPSLRLLRWVTRVGKRGAAHLPFAI